MTEIERDEFSVAVFDCDGGYWYECRFVSGEQAVYTAKRITDSVGAKMGLIAKVIITDSGDCTNFMWEYGKGVTYPPR